MSLLTSEQITRIWLYNGSGLAANRYEDFARAIEAATAAKYAERIAELEAWKAKIIKESEEAYGESAIRYKFSLTKSGKCMNTFPKSIDGRWFALTPAENDGHIGHIARIAELQAKLDAAAVDAGRWRRLVNASEANFPPATMADDPENDAEMIYGRKRLEEYIDRLDEIPDFYDAMRTGEPKA